WEGIARTDGIHQHAHFHAAPDRIAQRIGKYFANPVPVENIGFQHDAAFSTTYGVEHCGISFVARLQHVDIVAAGEIVKADRIAKNLHGPELASEGGTHEIIRRIEVRQVIERNLASVGALVAECRTPDAVYASNRIDHRSHDGRKHNHADPADGCSDFLFRHGRVNGGDRSENDRQDKQDMRPVVGNEIEHHMNFKRNTILIAKRYNGRSSRRTVGYIGVLSRSSQSWPNPGHALYCCGGMTI